MSADHVKQKKLFAWTSLLVALLAANYYWFESPVTLGFDPNSEKCIPDLHLSLMVKQPVKQLERGDLVFWKPQGALSYVKQDYVMKRVTGVPGDRLRVKDGRVEINGQLVSDGMPLVDTKSISLKAFERDEVIPRGHVFMSGVHQLSNDSRYWGYLDVAQIVGKAHEIF